MSRYCLDTVAYSHSKHGEPRVVELLDRAEWIGVPVAAIGELRAGFARGARMRKNLAELDEFLSMPVVDVLPVERHVAGILGEIVADLRRRPILAIGAGNRSFTVAALAPTGNQPVLARIQQCRYPPGQPATRSPALRDGAGRQLCVGPPARPRELAGPRRAVE